MKSESAIRRHRANLRLLLNQPCGCRGQQGKEAPEVLILNGPSYAKGYA